VLGHFMDKRGKSKIVVGCKDFTQDGSVLHEFSKIGNSIVEDDSKFNTTIENVNTIINEADLLKNKKEIKGKFWDMFVIDALIGNGDRHMDNWGMLEKDGAASFAPIYDCGSTLGALQDDQRMESLLDNSTDFRNEEYNVKSCYAMGGKRIFYHEIFKNPPDELKEAIIRTVPKIQMKAIEEIVDSTEQLSQTRKEYLKKAIQTRYDDILNQAFKKLTKEVGK
jgi:hypothetical protein